MEKQILEALQNINNKLDRHDNEFKTINSKLDKHDNKFKAISSKLDKHDNEFKAINSKLDKHDSEFKAINSKLDKHDNEFKAINSKLDKHDNEFKAINSKLDQHDVKFDEQKLILTSVRSAQEDTTAKINEMTLQNTKDFSDVKEQINNLTITIDLLKNESWQNKHDIHRIKTTMDLKKY
jgi:chromosome segregation ATPase